MYNGREIKKAMKEASKLPRKSDPFKHDVDYTSLMGYRDDSPFNNRPYIDINTPNGMIDMSATGISLMANGKLLPAYSGMHDLGTTNVREIPVAKQGGPLPDVEKAKSFLEAGAIYGHRLTQKQIDAFNRIVGDAEEEGEIESEDYESSGEYRRGGQKRLPRGKTSQNIKTSLNFLLARNKMLYGLPGRYLYDPNAKFEDGGWLDQYQNAGTTGVKQPYIQKISKEDIELAKLSPEQRKAIMLQKTMKSNPKKPDMLRATEEQGLASKAWEVASHPFTAATNLVKHGRVPDNFSQGDKNYIDYAADIVNPAFYVNAAKNTASNLTKKETYTDMPKALASAAINLAGDQAPSDWNESGMRTLGKVGEAAVLAPLAAKMAPYAKYYAKELPHHLPKVEMVNGKIKVTPPEYVPYYRAQPTGFNYTKAKESYNPELTAEQNTYTGDWVQTNKSKIDQYLNKTQGKSNVENPTFDIIAGKMPKTKLQKTLGHNLPEGAKVGMNYGAGDYGTWDNAFKNNAISKREFKTLQTMEDNVAMFDDPHYDKLYREVKDRIAKRPEMIDTEEALLDTEKMKLHNVKGLGKKTGLTSEQAEEHLKLISEKNKKPWLGFYPRKHLPFKEGGATNWLDKYK